MNFPSYTDRHTYHMSGLFTLSLRLVTGWTYFSAFWRRLLLASKLDEHSAGYIGHKFNHFLPHALLIRPGIAYLLTHRDTLWWFMLVFTIVEGLVGLLFMLGLLTRMMSIGVLALALGILLGAGWLGTTCLDEWQIGVLGIAAGFTVFLSGGGIGALDSWLLARYPSLAGKKLFLWLGSGTFPLRLPAMRTLAFTGAILISALTLFTNQYFHGGLWGKLHNLSVKPHVEISAAQIDAGTLSFTVFRDEGADVYGSFLIEVALYDPQGDLVLSYNAHSLAAMSPRQISNTYINEVKPGKHSLVIPLGAKARLSFFNPLLAQLSAGAYTLQLSDVSGITWTSIITVPG